MPSWNIHIAQTERLIARGGAVARAVRDRNAFLFGNLVPDIMVGYMVPGVEEPIAYRTTHFAAPEFIPKPREREFWDDYVAPAWGRLDEADRTCAIVHPGSIARERECIDRIHFPQRFEDAGEPDRPGPDGASEAGPARTAFDLTLGAWAHLLADNLWNTRVNEYLDANGIRPSREFRIKKQGDFDGFGKMFPLDSIPRETGALRRAAAGFAQYPIPEGLVHDAIVVAHETVRTNGVAEHAPYQLLTEGCVTVTFAEVLDEADRAVAERLGF